MKLIIRRQIYFILIILFVTFAIVVYPPQISNAQYYKVKIEQDICTRDSIDKINIRFSKLLINKNLEKLKIIDSLKKNKIK